MDLDQETVDQIRDLNSTAKRQAEELKKKANEAEAIQHLWTTLYEVVQKNWPAHITKLIDEESAQLKRIEGSPHSTIAILDELRSSFITVRGRSTDKPH